MPLFPKPVSFFSQYEDSLDITSLDTTLYPADISSPMNEFPILLFS